VFGGLTSGSTYYVKTISNITNKITVSDTLVTGIAGPTFEVTDGIGEMLVNIQSTNGLVWTDPIVIHNGTNLVLGEQGIVSETKSGTNSIVVNSTDNYAVGDTVIFSDAIFDGCGLTAQTQYYITSINGLDSEFTVSLTLGGADVPLTDATGIALCVTNDYAITIADAGITAKLVFANQYNQNDDFVVLSIFGETAPAQYGYTVPEVQLINLVDASTVFELTNFVGGSNPENAIVEYNGLRLIDESDYIINSTTNELILTFAPVAGGTIAVTTYNLTDRQYLHTTYGGSFSGSSTTNLTVSDTTHTPGFDDELVLGELVIGTEYVITDLGTTTQADWNIIAGTSAVVYSVGDVITCDDSGTGMGDGIVAVGWDGDISTIIGGFWSPGPDFLTLSSGNTSSLNINDAITFSGSTFGGIISGQTYYVVNILDSTTFSVSATVGGTPLILTTASGSMSAITNPPTVANITAINNAITAPLAITNVTDTVAPNTITCISTTGFQVNQPILFKNISGTTGIGGVLTDGTVYWVTSISGNDFEISETLGGTPITVTNDSGAMVAYVGGNPAVTITTGIPHNLVENDIVRIDGLFGSTELNNNIYYAKIINDEQISLYYTAYQPELSAVNDPVTQVSSYSGGGYVWLDKTFTLITTTASATTASSGAITVADATELIVDTPIIFTGNDILGGIQSTVIAGSFIEGSTYQIIETGTTDWQSIGALSDDPGTQFVATGIGTGTGTATAIYYVHSIVTSTSFKVSAVRSGAVYTLTNDSGTMNVSQWEQSNVDRLWVTVNGSRIPSSALYLNPQNNLSILTVIEPGDVVIITSMMPSATPNQFTYVQTVNKTGIQTVFRANSLTRTWLTYGLQNVDDVIYLEDVSRVTETIVQTEIAPAVVDNTMSIGLEGNRSLISQVIVYNNSTGLLIDPADHRIEIENVAPILVIDIANVSPAITVGDNLTITVILGNLIFVNGEQIRFTTVDFVNNTLSGLQRGANGTGEQTYIPKYTEVYSVLASNVLPELYNGFTWNSYNYNLVEGDPLQISETFPATFLNADVP
jgi:hypothetical protein